MGSGVSRRGEPLQSREPSEEAAGADEPSGASRIPSEDASTEASSESDASYGGGRLFVRTEEDLRHAETLQRWFKGYLARKYMQSRGYGLAGEMRWCGCDGSEPALPDDAVPTLLCPYEGMGGRPQMARGGARAAAAPPAPVPGAVFGGDSPKRRRPSTDSRSPPLRMISMQPADRELSRRLNFSLGRGVWTSYDTLPDSEGAGSEAAERRPRAHTIVTTAPARD